MSIFDEIKKNVSDNATNGDNLGKPKQPFFSGMTKFIFMLIVIVVLLFTIRYMLSSMFGFFDDRENQQNRMQVRDTEQYKEKCNKGNAESCIIYGEIKKSLKDTQESNASYEKAIKILQGECGIDNFSFFGSSSVENEESCYKLAKIYNDGRIVKKDEAKALKYAQKACNEKGHSESCGMKNAKTQQLINEHQAKCKNDKNASSCMRVAQYRESENDGEATKYFYQKARKIYEEACDLGLLWDSIKDNGESCYALGQMYRNGQGIDKNEKQAEKYFKAACQKEYQSACDEAQKPN